MLYLDAQIMMIQEEADLNDPQAWGRVVAKLDDRIHLSTQDPVTMHQRSEEGWAQLKKWSNMYQFMQKEGDRTRTARLSFPKETI